MDQQSEEIKGAPPLSPLEIGSNLADRTLARYSDITFETNVPKLFEKNAEINKLALHDKDQDAACISCARNNGCCCHTGGFA